MRPRPRASGEEATAQMAPLGTRSPSKKASYAMLRIRAVIVPPSSKYPTMLL